MSDNKNKQTTHMNSLFNKIESMLTSNPLKPKIENTDNCDDSIPEIKEENINPKEDKNIEDTVRKEGIQDLDIILQNEDNNNDNNNAPTIQNTNSNSKRIDMSRMESLLNGM